MSLLLDALKKSEAQRRRGTSPTIDLTRTPSSASPRRPGSRWLIVALVGVLLVGVLLVAAAPWLWPGMSDWIQTRQGGGDEVGALADATNPASSATDLTLDSGSGAQVSVSEEQTLPPSVAGASSRRRAASVDSAPDGGSGLPTNPTGNDSGEPSSYDGGRLAAAPQMVDDGVGPENPAPDPKVAILASDSNPGASLQESRRVANARQQQQRVQASESSEPVAARSQHVNEPAENFIRPWELPQAERAEFPELVVTVHFYAERAADRFVLINGERYREGQRVVPGTKLVEVRQRGAVVEFGSYRVLIE